MKPQPDELFRSKLENFQMPAPAGAWSKVEAGLKNSSRSGWFWIRVAASVVLLLMTGGVLYRTFSPEQKVPLAEQSEKSVALENPVQQHMSNALVAEFETTTGITATTSSSIKSTKKELTKKPAIIDSHTTELIADATTLTNLPNAAADIYEDSAEQVNSEVAAISKPSAEAPSLYIVYTTDEVNQKYLRQTPEDDATSPEKKSSRMQMLMAVANNITTGDAGIGDLRQWKDEILALNFFDRKESKTEKH